jgi:hypothetical protein
MANSPEEKKDIATQIMAAMVRMPPKPHEEMKLRKHKSRKPDSEPGSPKRRKKASDP